MIIVKLMGGMGNQMFQYAFGQYLATRHNTALKLDNTYLLDRSPKENFTYRDYDLDLFNIEASFATQQEIDKLTKRIGFSIGDKVLNKIWGVKSSYIIEPYFGFSPKCFNAPDNSFLEGYWQSEKYFEPIKDKIRQQFTFKEQMSAAAKEMLSTINNSNAVAVNVRRGDFVTNPFHGTCSPEYYKQGESILRAKVENPHYFVFADEIDWAKENLHFKGDVTFVGEEYNGRKYQDKIRLMSACKHFIMPNSSFAWWAIWLNNNAEKIVIVPKDWSADKNCKYDIHLDNWIQL